MYSKPMIRPLDVQGKIYALQDAKGNTIGTGTREVCEVLMYVITKASTRANSSGNERARTTRSSNVRAAREPQGLQFTEAARLPAGRSGRVG